MDSTRFEIREQEDGSYNWAYVCNKETIAVSFGHCSNLQDAMEQIKSMSEMAINIYLVKELNRNTDYTK